jgi:hypothetical protein
VQHKSNVPAITTGANAAQKTNQKVPDGKGGTTHRVLKLLSEDPANYPDAPREGIRRVLEAVTGVPHPRCVWAWEDGWG